MDKAKDILVSLDNAGVCMSDKWLVRGVSLDVRRGEIVTLIGPNGSGTSTTAKMALGVINPSEGSANCRRDICVSYVPQKLSVDWTMPLTVKRFMTLTPTANERDRQRALSSAGVAHLKNSQVRNLSGGEFQRVLLARIVKPMAWQWRHAKRPCKPRSHGTRFVAMWAQRRASPHQHRC